MTDKNKPLLDKLPAKVISLADRPKTPKLSEKMERREVLKFLEKGRALAQMQQDADVKRLRASQASRKGPCRTECKACDPDKDGLCLWAAGLLQEPHMPSQWGVRASTASLTPSGKTAVPVIIMRQLAQDCRGPEVGKADDGAAMHSGCSAAALRAALPREDIADVLTDCPICEGAGVPQIAKRDDVRAVASILAVRVAAIALQEIDGTTSAWVASDRGMSALQPAHTGPQDPSIGQVSDVTSDVASDVSSDVFSDVVSAIVSAVPVADKPQS